MNERFGGDNGFGLERRTDGSSTVEALLVTVRQYREWGTPDMVGRALIDLADAYEQRAAKTTRLAGQDSSKSSELFEAAEKDEALEILSRLDGADELSAGTDHQYDVWEQRQKALADLLAGPNGKIRPHLAGRAEFKLDKFGTRLERARRAMLQFEETMFHATSSVGGARIYNDAKIDAVANANRQLGIGGAMVVGDFNESKLADPGW